MCFLKLQLILLFVRLWSTATVLQWDSNATSPHLSLPDQGSQLVPPQTHHSHISQQPSHPRRLCQQPPPTAVCSSIMGWCWEISPGWRERGGWRREEESCWFTGTGWRVTVFPATQSAWWCQQVSLLYMNVHVTRIRHLVFAHIFAFTRKACVYCRKV